MGLLLMLGNTFLDKVARPSSAEVGDQALRADQAPAINQAQTTADTALSYHLVGSMRFWAGDADPPGGKELVADGRILNIDDYPECAAACQAKFNHGDEAPGTFRIPDCRGRVPLGAGQGTGLTNRVAGATGGEEKHSLTAGEGAVHNHGGFIDDDDHNHDQFDSGRGAQSGGTTNTPSHNHDVAIDEFSISGNFGTGRRVYSPDPWPDANGHQTTSSPTHGHYLDINGYIHNHGMTINNAGSGTPHENMPPFLSINMIIRVAL